MNTRTVETFTVTYTVDGVQFDQTGGRPITSYEQALWHVERIRRDRFAKDIRINRVNLPR